MKKLLGLLAVAPMAIAACGGSTDTAEKTYDATAYAAVHGGTVYNGTVNVEDKSVALTDLLTGSVAAADCVSADAFADLEAFDKSVTADNGYAYSNQVYTFTDATDSDTCLVNGSLVVAPTAQTATYAGLGKAQVNLGDDFKVEEITIDEIKFNEDAEGTRTYFVRETWTADMGTDGYRVVQASEIPAMETAFDFDINWKRDDSAYMDGEWNPSMDALVEIFTGLTLAEAKTEAGKIAPGSGFEGDITGASTNLKHVNHYADLMVEAIRVATENKEII